MRGINNWILTVSVGTIICSIVMMFIPSKKYEQSIKHIIGLFMLLCFTMPVIGDIKPINIDYSIIENRRFEIAKEIDDKINSSVNKNLNAYISEKLNEIDININEYDILSKVERGILVVKLPIIYINEEEIVKKHLSEIFNVSVEINFT